MLIDSDERIEFPTYIGRVGKNRSGDGGPVSNGIEINNSRL